MLCELSESQRLLLGISWSLSTEAGGFIGAVHVKMVMAVRGGMCAQTERNHHLLGSFDHRVASTAAPRDQSALGKNTLPRPKTEHQRKNRRCVVPVNRGQFLPRYYRPNARRLMTAFSDDWISAKEPRKLPIVVTSSISTGVHSIYSGHNNKLKTSLDGASFGASYRSALV